MTIAAGVDACPAGWLCVSRVHGLAPISTRVFASATELFDHARDFAAIAVDIPVGLPLSGSRDCDGLVRAQLGPRKSSVFPVPPRAVVEVATYDEACAVAARVSGKKISKQTFELFPKILEVDTYLARSPIRDRVYEVHPELGFTHWNNGAPMNHSKKTGFGFLERYRLVESSFASGPEFVRAAHDRSKVEDDDILDAFAALWTAERILAQVAVPYGSMPPLGTLGMRIWS